MRQSSGEPQKNTVVNPPRVDHMFLDDDSTVQVRDHQDIVTDVMTMRDCSWPDAEQYIEDTGAETVERQLLQKGRNSTRWGNSQ